ncbi:hypothetical protein M0R45_002219 [Rubus argutus]|uniref:Uncharacterized protein n=1 Tax=Rubus argutus TaxID=59490 RepID=A0AAW1VIQ8_RUBAR
MAGLFGQCFVGAEEEVSNGSGHGATPWFLRANQGWVCSDTAELAEFELVGETHGGVKWHGSVMSGGAR